MHDTYRFLSLFRKENEEVVVSLLHENPTIENEWGSLNKKRNMYHLKMKMSNLNLPLSKWIGYSNKQRFYINTNNKKLGKAVFFVVNTGGKTNTEVADNGEVRAFFVDVDFAKIKHSYATKEIAEQKAAEMREKGVYVKESIIIDEEKKSFVVKARFTEEVIMDKKQRFRRKHVMSLKEALILETYSGFHVYFLMKNATTQSFPKIQEALCRKFGGDKQVKNLARLMRIPGFNHQKYEKEFLVKVIQWTDKYFESEEEFIEEMDLELDLPQTKGYGKEEHSIPVQYGSPVETTFSIIIPMEKADIVFKNPYAFELKKEKTLREALEEIKKEKLGTFIESPNMDEGEKILCPFHNDTNPSANTFISKRDEHMFCCHACEVGTKNATGLYMITKGVGFRAAITDLAKMLGIKIVKTEYEEEQLEKYQDNRMFLKQDLAIMFPNIAHYINQYDRKAFLRYFNDEGEVNISKEDFCYKANNIFFSSFRYISREMHKQSLDTVTKTTYLLNILGFIERVPIEEVHEELIKRSRLELANLKKKLNKQGVKGQEQAKSARTINYYIVPRWAEKAMEIEKTAKLMREKKFSLGNINKIELELLLGKEIANRVFPDGRVIPKRFEAISEKLRTIIEEEIRKKGFAVKEEILKKKIRIGKGGKEIVKLEEKTKVFERSIKEIVGDKYKTISIRSQKKKEEVYGYTKPTPNTITVIELKVN